MFLLVFIVCNIQNALLSQKLIGKKLPNDVRVIFFHTNQQIDTNTYDDACEYNGTNKYNN